MPYPPPYEIPPAGLKLTAGRMAGDTLLPSGALVPNDDEYRPCSICRRHRNRTMQRKPLRAAGLIGIVPCCLACQARLERGSVPEAHIAQVLRRKEYQPYVREIASLPRTRRSRPAAIRPVKSAAVQRTRLDQLLQDIEAAITPPSIKTG